MNALRTMAFNLVFYGLSVLVVLAVPISAMLGQTAMRRHALAWALLHRWSARLLLGITTRVEGQVLDTPALYPAKHQSMFETIELALLLRSPAIVMKRELADIPLWGWAARRYGVIVVDRDASATALRAMMRDAKVALDQGRSVLIFPEGTRVAPGETPPLRSGFAGLYKILRLPTVPVALDAGLVWPKSGAKRPGIITFRFGAPLPPGMPRAEVEAVVHAGINALETAPAAR